MYCTLFGSPFTGDLVTRIADDFEAGGPVAALVGDWPGSPRADVVALRLCGALHAAAPEVQTRIAVRDRAACDLNPLDIRDPNQVLRLRSYIWPDQADRLARFDGAVALALEADTRVERADAAIWIADKLASRAKD